MKRIDRLDIHINEFNSEIRTMLAFKDAIQVADFYQIPDEYFYRDDVNVPHLH